MTKSQRIVIVDDEKDVAMLTAKRLRALGYETTCFFKGEGVIEAILSELPDLVVLDIVLPGMSGYDLFERLKARDDTRQIPVIFFSANPSNEIYCLKTLRANGFVKKPYEGNALSAAIEAALQNQKRDRSLHVPVPP